MANQLKTKILLLNGTQADWNSLKGYVLSKGEPAIEFVPSEGSESNELTAVKLKVGDGFTQYQYLPYVGADIKAEIENELEDRFDEIESSLATAGNAVFQIDASDLESVDGATEADKIAAYITEAVNEGNVAIVKKQINENNYSYTAYVYTKGVWAAMDGNYNAENVYFNEDLTFTANIGALTLASGKSSGTYEAAGKSLEAVLKGILAKTVSPTITSVSYTLASDGTETDTGTKEIGSKITKIKWNGTFNSGKYSYGSVDESGKVYTANDGTGITATYAMSNDKDESTSTSLDGNFTLETPIQIDSTDEKTYATVTGTATWNASVRTPVNNIGDKDGSPLANGNSTKSAEIKATGYRDSFYYVGNDITSTIDSAFIRDNGTSRGANTKNFNVETYDGKSCLTIPGGTNRIVIAVPGTATLNGVTDIDGMGLDVKGNFNTTTVQVAGANGFTPVDYTVFVCDSAEGIAATHYTFSIS